MARQVKGIWIPIEIWLDKSLTWNERILLMEIDSFTARDLDCYFSDEYIADLLGLSKNRANSTLASLIKKGYVSKTRFDGRRRFVKSNICFSVEGLPQSGKADLSNAVSQNYQNGEHNNISNKPSINNPLPIRTHEENVADAQSKFHSELSAFREQYGADMLQAFEDYWGAPIQRPTKVQERNGVLLYYQTMGSWSLAGRLRTWARKEQEYNASRRSGGKAFGPRVNERGETPMVESFRLAAEAEERANESMRRWMEDKQQQNLEIEGGEDYD